MNYLTVFTANNKRAKNALLDRLKKYGGGADGDSITVLCSQYEDEATSEFKNALSYYFDSVHLHKASIPPYDGEDDEAFSDRELSKCGFLMGRLKTTCYFPMGSGPSEDDWSANIINEYRRSGKEFMGATKSAPYGLAYLYSSVIVPASFFLFNPCFRAFSKKETAISRARNYTRQSLTSFELPFSNKPLDVDVKPPQPAPEPSEDEFDITKPKKVESVSTGSKQAKKKTAKKKTAKKKAAKKRICVKDPNRDLRVAIDPSILD